MGVPWAGGGPGCGSYPGGVLLRDTTEAAVKLQVLPPRQQVCDGVELGAVTHVLVDGLQVGEHAAGTGTRLSTRRGRGQAPGTGTRLSTLREQG